jgi:hypothetical protein
VYKYCMGSETRSYCRLFLWFPTFMAVEEGVRNCKEGFQFVTRVVISTKKPKVFLILV